MAQRRGTQKSALMTPDPYHVPGYGGFCPQFKYQIGETFGRTTSHLLTDTDVASSGKLVLAKIDPSENDAAQRKQQREQIIRDRRQSWGDQKHVEHMVPGYTGYIPKSQHYFGKRYAKNCVHAISDFETHQRQHAAKMHELGPAAPKPMTKSKSPLKPIAKEAEPYIIKKIPQQTRSPYYMDNDNEDKRFVSGYTGFVPRCRGLLGFGYPIITRTALNEFTDHIKQMKCVASKPVEINRKETMQTSTTPIYPIDSGVVPRYTGHIPGEKFRYGDTFGHSTKNAKAKLQGCK